jgi:predicted metal-binding membrane protein
MEAARLPRPRPVAVRGELALAGALVGLAALAWVVSDGRMDGMDMGPGSDLGGLGFYIVTWVVMMAAMMFPSVLPVVSIYRRLTRDRAGSTSLLVAGYLATWAAAGFVAYAVFQLGKAVAGDALAWDNAGQEVAVGVLAGAAVYELTPLKNACLRRCRGPLSFFMESWRDGPSGAFVMGLKHGAWCVGCCWALMAALFALGVMSLTWMALVAALIAVEKLLPWRLLATWSVTVVLLVLAVGVATSPADVPALTLPSDNMGGSMDIGGRHESGVDEGGMDKGGMKDESNDMSHLER